LDSTYGEEELIKEERRKRDMNKSIAKLLMDYMKTLIKISILTLEMISTTGIIYQITCNNHKH